MDESTNDGIVNVGDGNDGGAAMNPATGTEPAAQSTDAYSVTYAAAARLNDAPESAAPASVWDEMSHKPQPAAAATHENKPDISDYAKQSKPTFPISQLPDLRETLDPKADMNPEEVKSREEFTTVYDIIDSMEATLEAAKTSLFAPSMVRVDREEFAGQLDELKRMLPVQLERASALMREAERRLESAQTQANAIIASAQSRAADTLDEANKQAQLGKLSHDVQAGLNVLEERQRAAGEQMPHLNINDYPEAQ